MHQLVRSISQLAHAQGTQERLQASETTAEIANWLTGFAARPPNHSRIDARLIEEKGYSA
jgi:hypothetical protein